MQHDTVMWMCSYVMTNLTKLMVLVSSASKSTNPKFSEEITALCTQIEKAYKKAVSNPFYVPGSVRLSSLPST